jgi:formylmethanofuran dehydrogenase subunit E
MVPEAEEELMQAIRDAEKLHGHLGPFLVIGTRMGKMAQRDLHVSGNENKLQIVARTPPSTPFTCVVDGIQSTTKCTVGNQKLRIENSNEIAASFTLQDTHRSLNISLNPQVTEDLMKKISESRSAEELAWEIARTPEARLFSVERR